MATTTEARTQVNGSAAPDLPASSIVTATASPTKESAEKSSDTVSIALDIYSDNVCPFCYLGYRKIQAAMKDAQEKANQNNITLDFEITFKPFLLDPTLPCDKPMDKKERYAQKFGDRAPAIFKAMTERGKEWGINFSYDGPIRNTFLSHRLLEKALRTGGSKLQLATIERLFEGYFEQKKDIGDPAWLAEVSVAAGVFADNEKALAFLDSSELKQDVCDSVRNAQSLGISGVPFTVVDNKYAVSGAQEPAAFFDVFKKIACGQCPCSQKS